MNSIYKWQLLKDDPEAWILAQELNLPHEIATLLVNRGIKSASEAAFFLYGGLNDLHDPFLMKGMKEAVERILRAVKAGEKILVFGDYDVDGMLSVVMLVKALRTVGGKVDYLIPERMKDGYGLKVHHLPAVIERKTNLVISVDCGIKAFDFVRQAKQNGIDVIITDHHHPGDGLPEAAAILNPVLESSGYPDRNLAGVGVVFKLIQAIFQHLGIKQDLTHYLKLVSIGTVADVAELKGENRILVKEGLKRLREPKSPGLRSLLKGAGLDDRKLNEIDLGFRLGPRINAAGRLGMTEVAVKLFFSESPDECEELVRKLNELNYNRQKIEERILKEAVEKVESRQLHQKYRLLVLGSENWHRGVIGIVASRLKELYYRPVILFAYENGKAYGSGRSIPELSLIELVSQCGSLMQNYGGHKQAIGCLINVENLPLFKEKINELAEKWVADELLERKLTVDCRLPFSAITPSFVEFYTYLLPFGIGNPRPVFLAEEVDVLAQPSVMQNRHLKLWLRQGGRVFEAIGWEKARLWKGLGRGSSLDIAYSLQVSDYRGKKQVNLTLEDIRPR
ncbi:MAG: single-stranded-DNA-specific exonuclease RecJ [Candidatus Saccharicenans sp.]